MNTPKSMRDSRQSRKGAIAAMTAFLLMAILGLIACALDIGWIEMTRTQLQAVADASALAGGTELMPGLQFTEFQGGQYFPIKTPDQVVADATPVAVEYAGYNRNAELASTFVDGDRDVKFGKATFDEGCGCWQKTPAEDVPADDPGGVRKYYNYIEVTTLRNQAGSANGDRPAPLFFARIYGFNEKSLRATATAAILPAIDGFRVNEGSDDEADVMPFAFKELIWKRFKRAQEYYNNHPGMDLSDWNTLQTIKDTPDYPDQPLFGALKEETTQVQVGTDPIDGSPVYETTVNYTPQQLFFDDYTRTDAGAVSSGADGKLEIDIYPRNLKSGGELPGESTSGNFGTVDFGAGNNSTNDLKRQIREGLNADDFSYFENNQIVLSAQDPLDVEGDTGVSGGIKAALNSVIGKCKAIALFTTVEGPGNNAIYELVDFVSATVVHVNFQGSVNDKELRMQPCILVDDNAIADTVNPIDETTEIFTSLILIR